MPNINKRHLLVVLIVLAQAITMISGVVLLNVWMRREFRFSIHEQVLADNVQTAKQMTMLFEQMQVTDLRRNEDSWLRTQQVIREIHLPNDGFVCIVGASDGKLLCHPDLGESLSGSPDIYTGKKSTDKQGIQRAIGWPNASVPGSVNERSSKIAMKPKMKTPQKMMHKKMASDQANVGGDVHGSIMKINGELEIIAAAYIPELDAHVKVHQKTEGIEKRINAVLKPLLPIGLTVSFGLIFATAGLVLAIMRRYDNHLASINENLEHLVEERTRALHKTRGAVIFGLAKLAESRDTDTGEHLERIRIYTTILAGQLSQTDPELENLCIETLALASSLHDIGKVGIPDQVLLKPGKFTPDERQIMEKHSELGGRCLQAIGEQLGEDNFLQMSREIAYYHHEKWDGSGYPLQLAGDAIPLSARIVALVDVYDALRSRRPYKDPMPHEQAKSIIVEGRGSHFDPRMVDAFLACETHFIEVSERYSRGATSVAPEAGVPLLSDPSSGQEDPLAPVASVSPS